MTLVLWFALCRISWQAHLVDPRSTPALTAAQWTPVTAHTQANLLCTQQPPQQFRPRHRMRRITVHLMDISLYVYGLSGTIGSSVATIDDLQKVEGPCPTQVRWIWQYNTILSAN